jgi:uncharacterized protein YndB with AHSA1/START domain
MLNIILIAIAVIVVLFVVVVATRPVDYSVTRSGNISAPPAVVFAQVNELKKWEAWNPWGKIDPAMKLTYEGPPAGTGASYRWVGNNQVGEGSMTVTESRPDELVRFRLDFLKPFKGTSTAEFTFKSQGSQTAVTWSMSGKNNFMAKAIHLCVNMDKMIGGQFEKGLADLKSVAEAAGKK